MPQLKEKPTLGFPVLITVEWVSLLVARGIFWASKAQLSLSGSQKKGHTEQGMDRGFL